MSIRNLIILSQLSPPAQRSRILARERVLNRLRTSKDYSLTILAAGTGYGKSTSIVSLINSFTDTFYWFTISGTDRDPKLFLANLFSAFNQGEMRLGDEAIRILELPESTSMEALITFVNTLSVQIKDEVFFILDDFHRVSDNEEVVGFVEWIIEHIPSCLHIIIASRTDVLFPKLVKWRAKGEVLEITKDVLAFNRDEIYQLFNQQYNIDLPDQDIDLLIDKTEGWAIGLQMVWQTLSNNPGLSIKQVLEDQRHSKSTLFDYLADEVLGGLEPKLQAFLLQTSILSKLESTSCDFLLNIDDSELILRHLDQSGLFIEALRPGVYRYHQMFREFLLSRLQRASSKLRALHLKIASYFRAHEYWEEAIFHFLSADDYGQVNQILEEIGKSFIGVGRQETVNFWIHQIPKEKIGKFPFIVYLSGEVNRLLGNFDEALENYHTAERLYRNKQNMLGVSRALRGQGQVFLDTIRPSNGDRLLQEALTLLDPVEMREEVADLLVLIAENQLNLGNPENATQLLEQARHLQPDLESETDFIQARVYLRTGRFKKGIDILIERENQNPPLPLSRPQRFHRESTLLLSLFYSIMGNFQKAETFALQGIDLGVLLGSKFVQAVGYMRWGHAIQLRDQNPFSDEGIQQAKAYYRESIKTVDVVRIHVEPLWGLCRALGYSGQFHQAEETAIQALSIAKKAGDEWISVLIQISVGASAVLAGSFEMAEHYLTLAETTALHVKDPFTICAARLWLAIKAWQQGFQNTAFSYLEKCINLIKQYDYSFIFTKPSFLGLKDTELVFPLLVAAKQHHIERDYVETILDERGINHSSYHPGYSLWIKTFGGFWVWRGNQQIDNSEWKREKARQFFQLLVNHRDKWLHKDKIIEILWPNITTEKSNNYIKVVYNTINQVLEPDRPRNEAAFFVERMQDLYRLNPKAKIIVDADLFIQNITEATTESLSRALNLYSGSYFEDNEIVEWMMVEEQYYRQQFLIASGHFTEHLIDIGEYEKALNTTYKILREDEFYEAAYRTQMKILHKMGRDSMIHEVYHRCKSVLKDQLNTMISDETEHLYHELIHYIN